jgi:hypothetical protein
MNAPPDETRAAPGTEAARRDQPPAKSADRRSRLTISGVVLALPPDVLAALVELLPDPAAEAELRRQLGREAYAAGLAEGYRVGYERGARLRETEWPAVIAHLDGPTHDELEALRYGPRGREHFADPRPGDRLPRIPLEAAS